ncbi:MAG: thiamine pyrophosphate binding protein [Microbacteriaceae bacterium]|nr:thiamine pyrophosphate binding protein [Microbacteriaceae bacterium]
MSDTRAPSVRDACLEALRAEGLTTIFSNPGSTEVPFLVDLPDDFRFVLALQEGSVVGIATGFALAQAEPALVLLHTTAGLGNAVGAIATARVNRAPLVVVVGQQDRRHLALEPFLAGRLSRLAGDYPLDVVEPAVATDVPSALIRATHAARLGNGPVVVIVPMDDWDAAAAPERTAAAGLVISSPRGVPEGLEPVVVALTEAVAPAIIAGAGNDSESGWTALTALAERLGAPVWQEPFGARAGFPQDHPLFRGHLPADRPRLREALAGHDAVLVVGTALLRQFRFTEGTLLPEGVASFVLTADEAQAVRSPATLSIVGDTAVLCSALAERVPVRAASPGGLRTSRADAFRLDAATGDDPLRAAHVFGVLAERLPQNCIVVEESPSSRPALEALLPARHPFGFLSAAMGGLGFAMPAAIGLRMADPARPVVCIIGDGSSMYSIQSLWTAARHEVGVLFVVLANGGYAVMDRLADRRGGDAPWPGFPELSVATLAAGLGVETRRVGTSAELRRVLDAACTGLQARTAPLLVEVTVVADTEFAP